MAKKKSVLSEAEIRELVLPEVLKSIKNISAVSRSAIEKFYDDYTPIYYHRVYGLRNLFEVKTDKIENGYKVTFRYDAEHVTGKENHGDYRWAFDTAFIHGTHGTANPWGYVKRNFTPITVPSPWKVISDYVNKHYDVV